MFKRDRTSVVYQFRLVLIFLLGVVVFATGCSTSRYQMSQDRGPSGEFDLSQVKEPVPRRETPSRGGNKSPYTVWGKSYHVLPSSEGYVAEGVASWYGLKFHGHLTSNGETYNMYDFSAAHKHLPLPTYARVTNLENGKQVVVRVNDRGPFHGKRLIDLSYAAAMKLGFEKKGTARVRVEAYPFPGALDAGERVLGSVAPATPKAGQIGRDATTAGTGYFLQVGAYSRKAAAESVRQQVAKLTASPVLLIKGTSGDLPIYRVTVGPFTEQAAALKVQGDLRRQSFPDTLVITRKGLDG